MKERLTGAIILVALIVLLVPELLTGPIRTKSAAAARVAQIGQPSPAKSALRTYTLTLGAAPFARESASAAQAQPTEAAGESPTRSHGPQLGAAPRDVPSPAKTAPVAHQSPAARSSLQAPRSPAHRPVREARSSPSRGGWVVQLGSFASRENANHLAGSLRGRGFHVSVSPARAGSRVLWRVRAGPVSDRTRAGRLAARLRALGHRGELLPLK
ncbi:MAG: SPOR domain-containing protein [Steroidobacteraceae bacterium]